MTTENLITRGYFPKELPPCFFTERLGANLANILSAVNNNSGIAQTNFERRASAIPGLTNAQIIEEKIRLRQIFKNRLYYSDPAYYSIPKPGLARNIIKITNPLHQSKLSEIISSNYSSINLLYKGSKYSTTKPIIETDTSQGKRSVKHENYGFFRELCTVESFNFSIQLKTDISKFYPSIYTHTVPWVTFGGKERYKRNRALNDNDPLKQTSIYGDDIDKHLMWCQNQQTIGIPVGPDTSFIIAELLACHVDELLEKSLNQKKINHLGFRYYDDYALYFHSELDALFALSELKNILNEFELKINDDKTHIKQSHNELESEWALAIKSFYFRPSESDQKEDLWNFFSIAFKYFYSFPSESVLRLALNKFNFVRIEKENWEFFESLIFRTGLADTGSLQKIAKLLISYKSLVNKKKLKDFCTELINRNHYNRNDYELTWALWLMNEFNLQPTKDTFGKLFKSQCTCSSIIALDLLSRNKRIKNFNFDSLISLISTDNLNSKHWLLVYESTFKGWIPSIPQTIITDHFYFDILRSNDVFFYDSSRQLEPLKVKRSNLDKIDAKISQISNYVGKNKSLEKEIAAEIIKLKNNLSIMSFEELEDRKEVQNKLTESEQQIKALLKKVSSIQKRLKRFESRKPFFVIEKRLEELDSLTSKEIETETKQNKELLYDPKYDE